MSILRITLMLCLLQGCILAVRTQEGDEDILAFHHKDKSFGLRQTTANVPKMSTVQWIKTDPKSKTFIETTTLPANFQSAKNLANNKTTTSTFHSRTYQQIFENYTDRNDKLPQDLKPLVTRKPLQITQQSATSDINTVTVTIPKSTDTQDAASEDKEIKPKKHGYKVKRRRKIKIRKPKLRKVKVYNETELTTNTTIDIRSEISTYITSEPNVYTSDNETSTHYYSVSNTTDIPKPFVLTQPNELINEQEKTTSHSNEESFTKNPEISEYQQQESPYQDGKGSIDDSSWREKSKVRRPSKSFGRSVGGRRKFSKHNENITHTSHDIGLTDDEQTFPSMRPTTKQPAKIETTLPTPTEDSAIKTYIYGKPNAVTAVEESTPKYEPKQIKSERGSKKITNPEKNKNIWIKQTLEKKLKAKDSSVESLNKNQNNFHSFFYIKGETSTFPTVDVLPLTISTVQWAKNDRGVQLTSKNSTFPKHPFHNPSPPMNSFDRDQNTDRHLQTFLHFGSRNNSSVPVKRDVQPLDSKFSKKNEIAKRKALLAESFPLEKENIEFDNSRKDLGPKTNSYLDLTPSENKQQYFVHIFRRFGEYAKPHIGVENNPSESSPVNYLTSLRMQWNGNNNNKAKVVTEAYQDMKSEKDIHNTRHVSFNLGGNKDTIFPSFNIKQDTFPKFTEKKHVSVDERSKVNNPLNTFNEVISEASGKEIKVDHGISTNKPENHTISKRSIRVGGKIVRILPLNASLTSDSIAAHNNSYNYSIQSSQPKDSNLNNINKALRSNFGAVIPKIQNHTLTKNSSTIPLQSNVSVVAAINVTNIPSVTTINVTNSPSESITKREITTYRASRRKWQPTISFQSKTTPTSFRNQMPETKNSSTSAPPRAHKVTGFGKYYKRKKLLDENSQTTPETSTLPYEKSTEKSKNKTTLNTTKKFDILRLPSASVVHENITVFDSSAKKAATFQMPRRIGLSKFSPKSLQIDKPVSQIASPPLEADASESVTNTEESVEYADVIDGVVNDDRSFAALNPLDKSFYSSVPSTYEDLSHTTEDTNVGQPEYAEKSNFENTENHGHQVHQETHREKDSDYRKLSDDRENEYYKDQAKREQELILKLQYDITINPISDWTNFGVYYESDVTTKPSSAIKSAKHQNSYEVHSHPSKTNELENDITHDTFANNPPESTYPTLNHIPKTSFRCKNEKSLGYYADPETNCQVFHLCLENGEKHSFLCPKSSLFNQKLLTCDWWHQVDCKRSSDFYELNFKMYPHRNHHSTSSHHQHHHRNKQVDSPIATPKASVDVVKPLKTPQWVLDNTELSVKRNHNKFKSAVPPEDRKKFHNEYKSFYKRPRLVKSHHIDNPVVHHVDITTTKKPIKDYSEWLRDKGSVFDQPKKKDDWQSAVTSDLKQNLENQKYRHWLLNTDSKLSDNKSPENQQLKKDYGGYNHRPPSPLQVHQTKSPQSGLPQNEFEHIVSKLESVHEVRDSDFKAFPKHLAHEHYRAPHRGNVAQKSTSVPNIPIAPHELDHKMSKVNNNGFIIFPINYGQPRTPSAGVEVHEKLPKTESPKRGFWTSENLRKQKISNLNSKDLHLEPQARAAEPMIRFNSMHRPKLMTRERFVKPRGDEEDCDYGPMKKSPSSRETQSRHSNAHYGYSKYDSSGEKQAQKLPSKSETPSTTLPKKIVAVKHTKDGKVRPVTIYIEHENQPVNLISNKAVKTQKEQYNKNNARNFYQHPSLKQKNPVKSVNSPLNPAVNFRFEIHPTKIANENHQRNQNILPMNNVYQNSKPSPEVHKTHSGYHFYYEMSNGKVPEKQISPVIGHYFGYQSPKDRKFRAEIEKKHPNLFTIENTLLNVNKENNINNHQQQPISYEQHSQRSKISSPERPIQSLHPSTLRFQRKRIINARPFGQIEQMRSVPHGSVSSNAEDQPQLKHNYFPEEKGNFKEHETIPLMGKEVLSPPLLKNERYSRPFKNNSVSTFQIDPKTRHNIFHTGLFRENQNDKSQLPYHEVTSKEWKDTKFHVVRPYGQTVKIGPLLHVEDHHNDKNSENPFKNRPTIPSTKTGHYLETAGIQSDLYAGNSYGTIPNRNRFPFEMQDSRKTTDMPSARKTYASTNSKVHFPRLDFKKPQIEMSKEPLFGDEPRNLYLKTVKIGPLAVQGDDTYSPITKQKNQLHAHGNLNEKHRWLNDNKKTFVKQEYNSNPPNNQHLFSNQNQNSKENGNVFESNSEHLSKPFHIIRPYGQALTTDSSLPSNKDKFRHQHHHHHHHHHPKQNPDTLYYTDANKEDRSEHLYNDRYNKPVKSKLTDTNIHHRQPTHDRIQSHSRDASKHVLNLDRDIKYYHNPTTETQIRTEAQNQQTHATNANYESKQRSLEKSPMTFNGNYDKDTIPEGYLSTKHSKEEDDISASTRSYGPPTVSVTYSHSVTGEKRSPQFEEPSSETTNEYTGVTLSDDVPGTTTEHKDSMPSFSPSPVYREPVTKAQLEEYKKLEKEAEKKAEEFVKKAKKLKR